MRADFIDAAATELLAAWRADALSDAWRRPADWYGTAVAAVVDAISSGADELPAVYRLGLERGHAGVGIDETLLDLKSLYRVRGLDQAPFDAIRALVGGWVEASNSVSLSVVDCHASLGPPAYLARRLRECYARAGRENRCVRARLLVLTLDADHLLPWQRRLAMNHIGELIKTKLIDRAAAKLGELTAAVVIPHDDPLRVTTADLRDHLYVRLNRLRHPAAPPIVPRVWLEALPLNEQHLDAFLLELGR